jgi:hypothetical protein
MIMTTFLLLDHEPALDGSSSSGIVYCRVRFSYWINGLPGLKFEHGSRVGFCRESILTRGNMNQIHATT